jgi:hypothetical protein
MISKFRPTAAVVVRFIAVDVDAFARRFREAHRP